ncbi:MAG TPA: bifunctional tetrahydrofolate synthase/dihydrofolate synthase [Steroidobacteraceae bacterium]|nr:bifunctional tetrahydrofolate synthase/dihydrofolate synthase [Steroidobacteraceae bacterium]HRX91163.1 bifunctional tetrahydrofolate synthase/dihydrofolate synthase [Steroidobacteraceae bacterium]
MTVLADWLARQQAIHPKAIDLSLERVMRVARALQIDQPPHPVITIGGTNGKGSTVAFVAALLAGAGHRVGVFTSPHLQRYNERIRIAGDEVTDAELVAAFERIDAARGDTTLTYFEFGTLAALDLFVRARVEFAVLEVGLGGRLDATNLVDADVAAVTSVGLDHMDWLGSSLESIGAEKAGIFRAGRPAVLGTADMPASVHAYIAAIGARPVRSGREFTAHATATGFDFRCGERRWSNLPRPALQGRSQIGNAATALATLIAGGFDAGLDAGSIAAAIATTKLPGRFQIVQREVEWLLDVAHNEPAAVELASNLRDRPCAGRTIAVCGILGDKDVTAIVAALAESIDEWVLVTLEGPRAIDAATLAARLPAGASVMALSQDVASGCELAAARARDDDRVLVFGSFLTVGPALAWLGL